MIHTPPFSHCPDCGYSQTGLPTVHRCPECGFAIDDLTAIIRPKRSWRPYLTTFSIELLAVLFCGSSLVRLLAAAIGVVAAGLLLMLLFAAMIIITAIIIHKANRRGRFVAISRAGITVRNLKDATCIPWEELSVVALRDITPRLERKRAGSMVSLHNLFDNASERDCFEAILSHVRSAVAGKSDPPPEANGSEIIPIIESHGMLVLDGVSSQPAPKQTERLMRRGLVLIAVGAILTIAAFFCLLPGSYTILPLILAEAVFIAGVACCVQSVFLSEARHRPRKRYPPAVRRGLILAGCGIVMVMSAAAFDSLQWAVLVPAEVCFWGGAILFCVGMWRSDKSR